VLDRSTHQPAEQPSPAGRCRPRLYEKEKPTTTINPKGTRRADWNAKGEAENAEKVETFFKHQIIKMKIRSAALVIRHRS
jgi:hypothetical protein